MRSLLFLVSALALSAASTGCTIVTRPAFNAAEPSVYATPAEATLERPRCELDDDEATAEDEAPISYFVQAGASYWPAELLARLPDGRAAMRFTANGASDKGLVEPARMFMELPDHSPAHSGEHLFVEWRGSYWAATVLSSSGAAARIHYEGYGPEWDETVGPDRTKRLAPAG